MSKKRRKAIEPIVKIRAITLVRTLPILISIISFLS
jgi:hypothetical protein